MPILAPAINEHVTQSAAQAEVVRDLLTSLTGLHERIRALTALTTEKLAALRAADVDAIEVLAQREAAALDSLQILDVERKAVLARLAHQWPNGAATELKLDDIASLMPEPFSSQIRAKSEGLRSAASALQQNNRLLSTVAHTLHSHIRGVFADLANDTQETLVYGRTGQHEKHTARRWVDAVG